MGSVWEGVHETLGTRVAVKFIDSEHASSLEARTRFANEARAAASLRSKHVVEVYDHGLSEDGRPFIVMEYLEGEPLDRRLDRLGRLPAKEVAVLLQQVSRALTKAHAAGIIHRDLKPENIILVRDEEDGTDIAKVVDFGIAKFTDAALRPSSATRTGSVLGTPYYMSPEQARGLRSVDHRADLWSLGVIAFRSVVGVLPFEGEAIGDLLVKLCTAEIPVPSRMAPDVPPGFDAFITKALSRDVSQRFASAQEFAASLSAVCGLSVRGAYGTGDLPVVSSEGGALHPGLVQTPSPNERRFAATTANPLVQTPPPVTPRSASRGPLTLVAAAIVIAAVGVSAAVLLRSSQGVPSPSSRPTGPEAATMPQVVAPAVSASPIELAPTKLEAAPTPVESAKPAPEQPAATPQSTAAPSAAPTPAIRANAVVAPAIRRPKPPGTVSKREIDIGY